MKHAYFPVSTRGAEHCKTSIPGSNPGGASVLCNNLQVRPGAGAPDCNPNCNHRGVAGRTGSKILAESVFSWCAPLR
jgi:hypothetical protein